MAKFEITGPDGARYEITAPDGASDQDVFSVFQSQFGNSVAPVDRPAPIPRPGSEPPARRQPRPAPQQAQPPAGPQQAPVQAQNMPQEPGRYAPTMQLDAKALPPQVDQVDDVIKSGAAGLVRGGAGLLGLPGSLEWLGRAGINKAASAFGAEGDVVSPENYIPSGSDLVKGIEKAAGPLYQPKTTAGKYAATIGEFAPGVLFPAAGATNTARMVGKVAGNWLAPAIASEAAGQATEGTSLEPYARVAGALAPSALPAVARRVVSPNLTPAEKARHVAVLDREGVPLTAGDRGGRKVMRYAEDVTETIPFGGGPIRNIKGQQETAFTRAALRRANINADRATPEVVDQAFREIGQRFDDLARNSYINPNARMLRGIDNIAHDYERATTMLSRSPLIRNIADDIASLRQSGQMIQGRQYAKWRSDLERAARGTADPTTADAFRQIGRTLDLAVERSMRQPEIRRQWRDTRRDYRNLLVIEKAISRQGEKAADGIITPANLASAARSMNKRQYARGRAEFQDLADAGRSVLAPLPQSGTAPRAMMQGVLTLGGAGALGSSGAEGAVAGGLGGLILGGLGARALMSRSRLLPTQQILSNQLARHIPQDGRVRNSITATSPQTIMELQSDRRKQR